MLLQLVIFNAATTSWTSKHFVNNFVHSVLWACQPCSHDAVLSVLYINYMFYVLTCFVNFMHDLTTTEHICSSLWAFSLHT